MGLFTTKPLDRIIAESEGEHALKRSLSATQLVALGIGGIIGAGLFVLTGRAAAANAGPAVVLCFVLAAVACAFAGLCYSEFATMIPVGGSAYTYAYATLGELLAWIIGWDLVLEYAVGAAAVAIGWSGYVVSLLHEFGIDLPAALVHSPVPEKLKDGTIVQGVANVPAAIVVIAISLLLALGIQESARVNAVVVTIKLAVVLVFIAVGLFYIEPANYTPFIPPNTDGTFGHFGWSGVVAGAGTVFFAYIGFDAVSTAAQEARNPQRDMPIGIIGSLVICTVLYVVFAAVMTGMVHYTHLGVDAPVAVAIDKTPFPWLRTTVKFAIIAGFTSVILVLLLGQSRVFYAMSRDGLLPKLFSDIHPKFRTPWRSNLLFMVVVGLLGAFVPGEALGHATSIGTLFAFVIVCASVLVMRVARPELPRPFRTPFVPFVPIAGIVSCVALMLGLGWDTWLRLIGWLAIGMVIYFAYGRRHSRLTTSN